MKSLSPVGHIFKKSCQGLAFLLSSLLLICLFETSAMAGATLAGFFTMLSAAGTAMQNTSSPYYASVPYYGMHTPISGSIASNGDGTFGVTVNSFNFFNGSLPAVAKSISVFGPGTYTFNQEAFTVAPGLWGAKMLFDWNGTTNIDVVLQLDLSGNGTSVFPDSHWRGSVVHNNGPFTMASTDDGSDGILGHPMWNGPFGGSNAVFDFNVAGFSSLDNLSDSDGDLVLDDGNLSGTPGDALCPNGIKVDCDDNCVDVANANQADCDGDGAGDLCDPVSLCSTDADGDGEMADTDCDDNDPKNFHGNTEVCDGQDNNCDSVIDEGFDSDGDGYTTCGGDCNDNDPVINPGASDTSCDGIDDNCSGTADDGYVPLATNCGIGFCASTGSTSCVNGQVQDSCVAGIPATEGPNGDPTCSDTIDNDCDGFTDAADSNCSAACTDNDGDGYGDLSSPDISQCPNAGVDCNDADASIYPGAQDICDGNVNDCSAPGGTAPDALYVTDGTCGVGACGAPNNTPSSCVNGAETLCRAGSPAADDTTCDGVDDNCNGTADEGYVVDSTCGVGACLTNNTASSCNAGVETLCRPGTPAADDTTCDGIDDNCNGIADEDYVIDSTCGVGACLTNNTPSSCVAGVEKLCRPGTPAAEDTTCDGIDDNCNGIADEDYVIDSTCGIGACQTNNTPSTCANGIETLCQPGPSALEDCFDSSNIDEDCDGFANAADTNSCLSVPDPDAIISGIFTMIDPSGRNMTNTSAQDNPWAGHHTQITGAFSRRGGSTYELNIEFLDDFFGAPPFAHGFNGVDSPIIVTDAGNNLFEAHMLFDWNVTSNIDVLAEWDTSGTTLPFWDTAGDGGRGHTYLQDFDPSFNGHRDVTWDFSITDDDGDGVSGHPMWNGPFGGNNANFDFNLNPDDADVDGYTKSLDCDDSDWTVRPGAIDNCGDGVDQDCDFRTCPEDTADLDGDSFLPIPCSEADTIVDPANNTKLSDIVANFSGRCGDCDDGNASIFPGAEDICDGFVNDCGAPAGTPPDDGLSQAVTAYPDVDSDTFGDASTPGSGWCSVKAANNNGLVTNNSDCDDGNPFRNPNGNEVCDGIDNDCDGQIDEGLTVNSYFVDSDGDGFGDDLLQAVEDCSPIAPEGTSVKSGDCDDADPNVNPNAVEVAGNNIDENCDGSFEAVVTISPGRYIFDINPDLPDVRAESGKALLKSYFAFVPSNKFRAVSTFVDSGTLNNGLPGNSAGLISFELTDDFTAFRQGENGAEEVTANIIIQGLPRGTDNSGNFIYPGDYKLGIFTSPGGDYVHFVQKKRVGRYDPASNSLELFLGEVDPANGADDVNVFADTQNAGINIVFPYDPIGTETYQNFTPAVVPGGCEITDSVDTTISGTKVSYNGKIFLYSGVVSFATVIQTDTNEDGTIDANDTLIDANEDLTIDENDIPDDLSEDGIIDENDMVDSWHVTLATAGNIPLGVPGFACIAFIHVYDGLVFPSQNTPPTAVAGEDVSADAAETVELDGTASFDLEDGNVTGYAWTLVSWPVESKAVLVGRDSATPSIAVDAPGEYVVSLAVKDSKGATSLNQETVMITVCNDISEDVLCTASLTSDSDDDSIPDWNDDCPEDDSPSCVDTDRDGIVDSEDNADNDPSMAFFTDSSGNEITIRVGAGMGGSEGTNKASFRHIKSLDTEGVEGLPPHSILLSYDIDVSHPSLGIGASVAVTINIPEDVTDPMIFKLVNGEVRSLDSLGVPYVEDMMGSRTITVTVTDGGPGDNGPADGIIIDPLGIGQSTASAGGRGGGGGGCGISSQADAADALFLLLPVFALVGTRWARKRVQK